MRISLLLMFLFYVPVKLFSQAGLLDLSFGTGGISTVTMPDGYSSFPVIVHEKEDGKLLIVTAMTNGYGFFQLLPDGTFDVDFGIDGYIEYVFTDSSIRVSAASMFNDSLVLLTGSALLELSSFIGVYKLNGDPYIPFDGDGISIVGSTGYVEHSFHIKPYGADKIIISGESYLDTGFKEPFIARFNLDGTPDLTFNFTGYRYLHLTEDESSYGAILSFDIQPDGLITCSGYFQSYSEWYSLIAQFKSDGSLDTNYNLLGYNLTNFGESELIQNQILQSDGKMVAVGIANQPAETGLLARFNIDGTIDTSFNDDGFELLHYNSLNTISTDSENRIYVGGFMEAVLYGSDTSEITVARYLPTGQIDSSFGIAGSNILKFPYRGTFPVYSMIQTDEKLLIASSTLLGNNNIVFTRYTSDAGVLQNTEEQTLTLNIYPNPTSGKIRIDGLSEMTCNIWIYSLDGQLIGQINKTEAIDVNMPIDYYFPEGQPTGLYFIKVLLTNGNKMISAPIFVKH